MRKKRGKKSGMLAIVMMVMLLIMSGCQNSKETEEEQELQKQLSEARESWENAGSEARTARSQLDSAIAEAEDIVANGSETETVELVKALEEAKKVYEANDPYSEKFDIEEEGAKTETYELQIEELKEIEQGDTAVYESLQGAIDSYTEVQDAKRTFTPTVTETIVGKDSTGVQIEATVKLSPWMKGDDLDRLSAMWRSAGGEEDFPINSDEISSELKNAVVLIGQISYKNLTPDFNPQSFRATLRDFYDESMDEEVFSESSSFGPKKYAGYWNDSGTKAYKTRSSQGIKMPGNNVLGTLDIELPSPVMEGRTNWGPAPFVLTFGNYRTAEMPDGDPRLDYIRFEFDMSNVDVEEKKIITPTKEW